MKQTETCPKCRGTKLFVVNEVQRRQSAEGIETIVPVTVTATQARVGPTGRFSGEQRKNLEAGRFEAWVCAACGFTEWYATRLNELAVLADATSAVRVIEREPEGGPYRA